jgi:uncharacterized membrane protein
MNKQVNSYFLFLIVYFMIDLIWVVGARKFHVAMIEKVQKEPFKANLLAAFIFYLIAPISFVCIIEPHSNDAKSAVKLALMIGGLMNGAFDLTNKTIFKNFSWSYTVLDTWWGMFNMALSTLIVFKILNKQKAHTLNITV